MGYLSIQNLYKAQNILLFREVWALEKVHGTSAHVSFTLGDAASRIEDGAPSHTEYLRFFAGGVSHERFAALPCFVRPQLLAGFEALGQPRITVYGEAYGGSLQGMKAVYGEELRFIVFDVSVGAGDKAVWLSVPDAVQVAEALGLEFVPYEKVSTDLVVLDAIRDRPSEVAQRRGCGADKSREGVVLRPLVEMATNCGRVIAKHKQEKFSERVTSQKVVDPEKLKVLAEADAIAQEWVVPNRLTNLLSHMTPDRGVENTGEIIRAMVVDIQREAAGEIIWSKDVERAIGKRTAQLFKARVTKLLKGELNGS